MAGFISFVCSTFLFVICMGFAMVYFGKGKRYRKTALYWGIPSLIFAVIGSVSGWYFFTSPAPATILEQPYVAITNTELDVLSAGEPPVFRFKIENGRLSSTVHFRRISCRITPFVPEKFLTYRPEGFAQTFVIPPHQAVLARWSFDGLVLTQDQINDLTAKKTNAELYLFAVGEYVDETGTHPLRACWRYDRDFPNHVAFCAEDMKFR